MTLSEIVTAINEGKKVYYGSLHYQVIYNFNTGYFIKSISSNHKIGLTWEDGRTLNGEQEKFFVYKE